MSTHPKMPGETASAGSKIVALLVLAVFTVFFAALLSIPHPITAMVTAVMATDSKGPRQ